MRMFVLEESKVWARDIVFVFMDGDSRILEQWLEAYHSNNMEVWIRAGSMQAALVVDIKGTDCRDGFVAHELHIEGPDGLLPNLDLVNLVMRLGSYRGVDFGSFRHDQKQSRGMLGFLNAKNYGSNLESLAKMSVRQAFGTSAALHGPFLRYSIDSVTISARARGNMDPNVAEKSVKDLFEYAALFLTLCCRIIESTIRSINNILEHLHQSFFFYLLPDAEHYVSISNYIPITCAFGLALGVKVMLVACFDE